MMRSNAYSIIPVCFARKSNSNDFKGKLVRSQLLHRADDLLASSRYELPTDNSPSGFVPSSSLIKWDFDSLATTLIMCSSGLGFSRLELRLRQPHGVMEFLLQHFLRRQFGQILADADAAFRQFK